MNYTPNLNLSKASNDQEKFLDWRNGVDNNADILDNAVDGKMDKSVYDPNGNAQDIFAYTDNAVANVQITVDPSPTQGSSNPVSSDGVYNALASLPPPADMVTTPGGATIDLGDPTGANGPHIITFDDIQEPPLTAEDISYDNTTSGMIASNVQNALDELNTGAQSTQTSLNNLFTSVSNGKSLVASAITDMGVSTAADATFQTMADNVRNIKIGADLQLYQLFDVTVDGTVYESYSLTFSNCPEFKYATLINYDCGRTAEQYCADGKQYIVEWTIDIDNNVVYYFSTPKVSDTSTSQSSGTFLANSYVSFASDNSCTLTSNDNDRIFCGHYVLYCFA